MINFKRNFGTHQFYLGAKYYNEYFNFYGRDTALANWQHYDTLNTHNQVFNKADFTLGVRSDKRTDSGWLYNAYLNYHLHNVNGGWGKNTEHNINAALRADIFFAEKHRIDVELGTQTYFYSPKDSVYFSDYQLNTEQQWKTNTVVRLLPAYLLSSEKMHLRLGLKTWFNFGREGWFAVSPDVKIDYFFKNFLNLYAGISGDYQVNSLANLTKENRYFSIFVTPENNTWTPFDAFGGFKVKVAKGLMLDAFLSWKYVKNEVFFVNLNYKIYNVENNTYENVFDKGFGCFENTGGLFNAGIRIHYNIKERVNIFVQMKYNEWNFGVKDSMLMFAWHRPALEINTGSEFKIGKGFFGSVNLYIASKPKALRQIYTDSETGYGNITGIDIISLPATFDLNFGVGYNIKKNISLFAQANHILALSPQLNYQNWYGYNSFGAHLLFGATILF
jgi:hypothetical protein